MNEEILKLADLSNVKEGDTIWTIPHGELIVRQIKDFDPFPLKTEIISFTKDGKNCRTNKIPSAFTKNPFETIGFQERWMLVSINNVTWDRRKVLMQKNGYFIAWDNAETDEAVKGAIRATPWQYAKEIEEPFELTLEEIAEKFGVSVESIKIKK